MGCNRICIMEYKKRQQFLFSGSGRRFRHCIWCWQFSLFFLAMEPEHKSFGKRAGGIAQRLFFFLAGNGRLLRQFSLYARANNLTRTVLGGCSILSDAGRFFIGRLTEREGRLGEDRQGIRQRFSGYPESRRKDILNLPGRPRMTMAYDDMRGTKKIRRRRDKISSQDMAVGCGDEGYPG